MRDRGFGRALRAKLLGPLAEGQCLGLGEDVRHQQVVVRAQRVEGPAETDQVEWDELRPLVNELIERVLSVRSRLAPEHGAGLVVDGLAFERHVLAVRLHRELLQVRGKALQVLLVRHHAERLGAEEVSVPHGEQAHDDRQVLLERGRAEMLVHRVEAGEEVLEPRGTDRQHGGQPDRRVH